MTRRHSQMLVIAASILLIMAIARALLPWEIEHTINNQLSDMGDYHWHVSDVDVNLWRGAYKLIDLKNNNKSGDVPVPFISIDIIDRR